MPILTRAQKQKLREQEIETQTIMAESEENTFHRFHQPEMDEITDEDIQQAQQDPKFHKFMEKFLEKDGEKYFFMLANQGVKLPNDFDVNQLKGAPKKTEVDS